MAAGSGGSRPPTDWPSVFGGPAWTRVTEPDGKPGQWYLHLFAPEQPDLDWTEPEVRAEFESILRFWFDRGADGFRIDVAHGLVKDPAFPDLGRRSPKSAVRPGPYWDQDGVHDIYRRWRAIADEYGDRMFVAEVFVPSAERLARYLRPDELHTAFDFRFLQAGWDATALRTAIDASLHALAPVGAPATWVLSNHDQTRHVTRFGRVRGKSVDPVSGVGRGTTPIPTDLELGRRRSRAALLLMLALPGCVYLYQGEELGLEEVEDLPEELLQDPTWLRSGHTIRGRDGCRVPLPWSGTEPPFGFGPAGIRAVAAAAALLARALGRAADGRPELVPRVVPHRAPDAPRASRLPGFGDGLAAGPRVGPAVRPAGRARDGRQPRNDPDRAADRPADPAGE